MDICISYFFLYPNWKKIKKYFYGTGLTSSLKMKIMAKTGLSLSSAQELAYNKKNKRSHLAKHKVMLRQGRFPFPSVRQPAKKRVRNVVVSFKDDVFAVIKKTNSD